MPRLKGSKGKALRRRYGHSRVGATLDKALDDLHRAGKKIETAHEVAPAGAAKAIVAGLHSDLFNTTVSRWRQPRSTISRLDIRARAQRRQPEAMDLHRKNDYSENGLAMAT